MFENPRRGRQARNFTTNVPKILDLKSSSEQIFFRKLSLGAPDRETHDDFHYMQMSLVISMQYIFGDDWWWRSRMEALDFRVIMHDM